MGNQYEGEEDHIRVLQTVSELCPAYKLYLSHHTRNSIASILGCCHLAKQRINDIRAIEEFNKIESATRHLLSDLERVGV